MNGLDELREWLTEQGFTLSSSNFNSSINECDWYAYRRIAGYDVRQCETNDGNLTLVIRPYQHNINGAHGESVGAEITGEAGGRWYKLQQYDTPISDLQANLPEIEKSLVGAWNALKGWLP